MNEEELEDRVAAYRALIQGKWINVEVQYHAADGKTTFWVQAPANALEKFCLGVILRMKPSNEVAR